MRLLAVALMVIALAPLPVGADSPVGADGAVPPGGSFVDDDTSVHQGFIEAIAAEGITKGCNPPANDRFCPDEPVTRGQMAAFLVRAESIDRRASPFTDTTGSVFDGDIGAIAAAGITKGCNPPANDRFCPGLGVTRGQMAAFLARAFELPRPGTDRFVDDDGSVFEADIDALAAAGLTNGCGERAFCPERAITRAEMATFLGRALGLRPVVVPARPATVDLVTRTEWGAVPPGPGLREHTIDHITIHHAGTATGTVGPAQFRSWQAYHRSLGWADIAYHFIIGRDGAVYEGRPFDTVGDTATGYDPEGHLLLVVEGNFDVSTPTPGQIESLARMVAWGSERFDVPLSEVTGHRDHAATLCPGAALQALIVDGSLTERAARLLSDGGVTLRGG